MRRFSRILLMSLVVALVPVGVASAQSSGDDGGVHVDPNSPSGREYDIPVQKARRQSNAKKKSGSTSAGSGSGNSGSGSSGSGLFGEGVGTDSS
jgi:hypothetical protein